MLRLWIPKTGILWGWWECLCSSSFYFWCFCYLAHPAYEECGLPLEKTCQPTFPPPPPKWGCTYSLLKEALRWSGERPRSNWWNTGAVPEFLKVCFALGPCCFASTRTQVRTRSFSLCERRRKRLWSLGRSAQGPWFPLATLGKAYLPRSGDMGFYCVVRIPTNRS